VARPVRQPRRADKIADRIDAGLAGAQPLIEDDVASIDCDPGVFDADIFDIADDANGEDDALNADDHERTDPA